MEFVVDACMGKDVCHWYLERLLLDIIEEISHIKVEVENILEKKIVEHKMNTGISHMSSSLGRTPRMNEDIVGFEDVLENLKDQLIRRSRG